ncbi:MAG: S-layer homology domain-containing protein, partial [Desulfotomaculaceae bacterium]|nr:S-layer homology domain-containing protein [Desulfotomaculaceae bacterium]
MSIKRRVLLGTVAETTSIPGEIKMENGEIFQIPPSAQVKKDGGSSRYDQIKQGDSISAVLLPDTGKLIGVVAYSSVLYGGAIGITKKDKTFYLLDDSGDYQSLYLSPEATFYRWGVKATSNTVSSGNLVKVTTSPDGSEVWRVDIAEDFNAQEIVAGYDSVKGIITTKEGNEYSLTRRTSLYKNGYPVQLEDILPGEKIGLRYTLTPLSAGKVLVSVNVNSAEMAPLLLASVIPLQGQLMVTGTTDPGTVLELWRKGKTGQLVPVNEMGQFNIYLPKESDGETFTLVAVNRSTGGIWGIELSSANFAGLSVQESAGDQNAQSLTGQVDEKITRAESAVMLARLLNWAGGDQLPLPFTDAVEIPETARPAVAEARARGIFMGYPDGSFQPGRYLNHAETAVVLASVLHTLGREIAAELPL